MSLLISNTMGMVQGNKKPLRFPRGLQLPVWHPSHRLPDTDVVEGVEIGVVVTLLPLDEGFIKNNRQMDAYGAFVLAIMRADYDNLIGYKHYFACIKNDSPLLPILVERKRVEHVDEQGIAQGVVADV